MYDNYAALRSGLDSGKHSVSDIVKYYVGNIEKGKHLNVFLSVFQEEALSRAAEIDKKIINKAAGKLAGMVIAVKDVLSLKGKKLTCGSKILENFEALYTATAVQRLIDEDAIIIGKTNCDEFAMGSSNENSAYGVVKNPFNNDRVPGGSSGGSAAAVAAKMCMVSLGTDTGGSIRQPAAFCGTIGFKPTYGRVSRYGLTAFASSFDTIGPFAGNIEDAALVLEVIAGKDENDSTSVENEVEKYSSKINEPLNKEISIGVVEDLLSEGVQDEIKVSINRVIDNLRSSGFNIKMISLPNVKYSIQA
jgi:aspartyl-tRNA(Asn)/glutamyl-tRNA(Gln) amidotransferase subunit A